VCPNPQAWCGTCCRQMCERKQLLVHGTSYQAMFRVQSVTQPVRTMRRSIVVVAVVFLDILYHPDVVEFCPLQKNVHYQRSAVCSGASMWMSTASARRVCCDLSCGEWVTFRVSAGSRWVTPRSGSRRGGDSAQGQQLSPALRRTVGEPRPGASHWQCLSQLIHEPRPSASHCQGLSQLRYPIYLLVARLQLRSVPSFSGKHKTKRFHETR